MGDIARNFDRREFECHCGCGFADVNLDFVHILQEIRDRARVVLVVMSGCRCPAHNEAVLGVSASAHTKGLAADIRCSNSQERYKLIDAAIKAGVTRIGIARTFIHFDIDTSKAPEVAWVY